MRQAAKLLGCLCRISSQTSWTVSNFIRPTQFKLVVQAAKECAGFGTNEFDIPSSAVKLGGMLKRLAEVKQVGALESGDSDASEECSVYQTVN